MTSWTPDLTTIDGPRYLAIAEALSRDVAAERLKPGDRLPTHRDLAWKLGVTVGTVTRAYAEAERRGLVAGEVGRGTFIREAAAIPDSVTPAAPEGGSLIDLSRNFPAVIPGDRTIADALAAVAQSRDFDRLLQYQASSGMLAHRLEAARRFTAAGIETRAEQVAISNGVQNGMLLAAATFARPGDTVLTESLTFYGIKSLANLLSIRLQGVAMDEDGLLPAALDAACRVWSPKALYLIPTIQNPTASVMPEERRREIAAICRRHDVGIIEDDIYGFLVERPPPPIARFAPERTVLLSGLSKSAAPGLRIGYMRAESDLIARASAAMRSTAWMASPILAEATYRLMRDGGLDRLILWHRTESRARQKMAADILAGYDISTHPAAFHIWLHLPEPWRREEFAALARARGVGVAPAEAFAVGRQPVPHAARIALSTARDRRELERALKIIAGVLADRPDSCSPLV